MNVNADTLRPGYDRNGLRDYNYCMERDAEHDPALALWQDAEMPTGYVTIECRACHQTTGIVFTMPDPLDIDWG